MECPRRAEAPFQITQPPDNWDENRWDLSLEELQHEQEVFASGGTTWRWGWKPHTCSYCGSTKPEHVLRLLAEGWSHEKAKSYKGYLQPPAGSGWSPVPCVKFYIMHFNEKELAELNRLLKCGA